MLANKPLLIGVTGGIGSGKSTVCQIFELLGIPVYYADDKAKLITKNDRELKKLIQKRFGDSAYEGNSLNKTYLAKKVFSNQEELKALNELIHPRVAQDFENWVTENNSHSYLLKEAALIFETQGQNSLSKVIIVTADEETRIQRVLKRDSHRTKEDIRKIINNQLPEDEKLKLSDYNINNSGNQLLIPQVLTIHESLMKLS